MSFLTPKHLQDASRILRSLALIAARSAAETPIVKHGARGDYSQAVRASVAGASKQAYQMAEQLEKAAAKAGVLEQMQQGQQAAEQAGSILQQQMQGAMRQGEQALGQAQEGLNRAGDNINRGFRDPQGAMNEAVQAAQQATEQAGGAFRQGAEQLRQQGDQFMSRAAGSAGQAAPEASQAAPEGAQDAAAQAMARAAEGMQQAAPETASQLRSASEAVSPASAFQLTFSAHRGTGLAARSAEEAASALEPTFETSKGIGLAARPAAKAASAVEAPTSSQPPVQPASSALGPSSPAQASAALPQDESVSSSSSSSSSEDDSRPSFSRDLPSQTPQQPSPPQNSPGDMSQTPVHSSSSPGQSRQEAAVDEGAKQIQVEPERGESQEELKARLDNELDSKAHAIASAQIEEEGPVSRDKVDERKSEVKRKLRERAVPASSIGRVFGFARLGASLAYGSMSDSVSRFFTGPQEGEQKGSAFMSSGNAERLADALCRMRGAALKLGQMLSIQDENMMPPQLSAALERVRAGADIMPQRQLHQQLREQLGDQWRDKLQSFEDDPLAAASIGQVHGAVLHDGQRVVLKIQYPGVARSISSDVDNLMRIISIANVLPKGLYVEQAATVAKRELTLECDYKNEAAAQQRFFHLVSAESDLAGKVRVPHVIPELCSSQVLCSQFVEGVPIDKVSGMSQEVRDAVGTNLLRITLLELFKWRFMQTDPNWGNFLYDPAQQCLNLIDFGAAREFPVEFVDDYVRMVRSCALRDGDDVILRSTRLGFLTGDESKVMMEAHTDAGFVVGEPFGHEGLYDFGGHGTLTKRVTQLGGVMMQHRLTAPPEASYSLHRKLSGAFLACIKLRARVPCNKLFFDIYDQYQFQDQESKAQFA